MTIEGSGRSGADATIIDPISGGGSNQTAFLIAHSSVTIADLTIDGQTNTSSTDNFFYGVNTDDAVGSLTTPLSITIALRIFTGVVLFYSRITPTSVRRRATKSAAVHSTTLALVPHWVALATRSFSCRAAVQLRITRLPTPGRTRSARISSRSGPVMRPRIAITGNHLSEFVATGFTDVGIYGSGLALDSQINNNTIDTTGDEQADDGIILTYLSNTRGTQLQVEGNTFTTDGDDVALTISHRSFGVSPANTPVLVSGNTFTETGTTGTGRDLAIQVSDTTTWGMATTTQTPLSPATPSQITTTGFKFWTRKVLTWPPPSLATP